VVRLPALPAGQPAQPAPQVAATSSNGRSLRVLVVDDNADAADSLAIMLRMYGHEVYVAYDGAAALEAAQARQPEVMLLDIGLPILNGYEVAERLQRQAGAARPVMVALTGYGQEENRRQASMAGFEHYLVKPVDPSDLMQLLSSVANNLDSRRRAAPPVGAVGR
jgi:CheY-like chemotaxis protein